MFHKSFVSRIGCILAVAGATLMPGIAKATVADNTQTLIDWDQLASGWTTPKSGDVNSFNVGEGTVDFKFELGSKTKFVAFGGSTTPSISSTLNGSQGNDNKSLHLQIDAEGVGLAKGDNSMTMTTSFKGFSSPLTNVSFMVYDIDISRNSWQDRVIIKGFLGNQVVNPIFSPVLTQNTIQIVNTYTLDGVRGLSDNDNGDQGSLLVSFASAIDGFELVFTDGDGNGTTRNPANHGIGIGDIKYTVATQSVPEPASVLGLLAFGAFGASSVLKRKQHNA
ncbi:PEP-CTERM putative exosortase interaction domain-containing protein [Nostoc sp. PCC 7524]|uniref:PEP-CTERM sorting domain-containing protein n=1 Tax=Nostoc sp. (strain ATCC 29411 / PCC 7524) TaxID=28072 RepID=UPI00029F0F06|nr:PEP-CTERM sorting domain-containing protein [Nostoc sp. PCC 7524]AFY46633.1 PEP-CTERM putative exosortase interaction domain-containing protein [Nostoc sp. PCC 7524]